MDLFFGLIGLPLLFIVNWPWNLFFGVLMLSHSSLRCFCLFAG
jgi:hypothetical protein